jgi:hypothetical protein
MLVLSACVARSPEVTRSAEPEAAQPNEPTSEQPEPETNAGNQRAPQDGERAAEIRGLIDELQRISQAMPGMSAVYSDSGFAPVADAHVRVGGFIIGNSERREESRAFNRLVEIGPEAIPHLLDALTDDRPTGYVARGMMWMDSGNEVHLFDDVPREAAALKSYPKPAEKWTGVYPPFIQSDRGSSPRYQVCVGDVCFNVLGQITNRFYLAARYQPTGGMVINTPVHSPWLAAVVRECWHVEDYRAVLLESLKTDLADGADWSHRRNGAATRLLYYFGDAGADVVLARLSELRAPGKGRQLAEFVRFIRFSEHPRITNALMKMFDDALDDETAETLLPVLLHARPEQYADVIRTLRESDRHHFSYGKQFLRFSREAVLFTASKATHARVREELDKTMDSARDVDEVRACLPATAAIRPNEAVERVRHELSGTFHFERAQGDAYALMHVLADVLPGRAMEIVAEQARHALISRRTAAAMIVGDVELQGWRAVLRDLLDHKDEAGLGSFKGTEMRTNMEASLPLAYRVCDIAAIAATRRDPALKFEVKGDYAHLDAQIETIRKALDTE